MKLKSAALALILAFSCSTAVSAFAQDDHRDRDQAYNQNRDESNYYNNHYYQQGWQDGQHHKRKNHHWKNEEDRRAYEAGFAHGDRGEQWQNHDRRDDHHDDDHHDNDHHDRDHS